MRYQRESEPPTRMLTAGAGPAPPPPRRARRRRSRGSGSVKLGSKRRSSRHVTPSIGPSHTSSFSCSTAVVDADGQADVDPGHGVRRDQVGRDPAFDGADIDGHATERLGLAGAGRSAPISALAAAMARVTACRRRDGQALQLLHPVERGAQPVDGVDALVHVRAVRGAARVPRPRSTAGPSRRSAPPAASRRRRRSWRRPAPAGTCSSS